MKKHSRVLATIDLDAIHDNFNNMYANLQPGTKMIAVIKADGYGHGAVPIARMMESYDYIYGCATATVEEALILREAGIIKPILILGYTFEEHFEQMIQYDLRPTVFQYKTAQKLSEYALKQNKNVNIHIALDTGMSRIGFTDTLDSIYEIKKISELENVKIEGLFTHFAKADEKDYESAIIQLDRYRTFCKSLERHQIKIPIKHCSNSAGIIRIPQANMDVVRAGITIYGLYPSNEVEKDIIPLKSALTLTSHISYIKELEAGIPISYGGTYVTTQKTRVATIPVGYADGYPRSLSNKGYVLIQDRRAPILGRVCMDQFMVDITDIPNVNELDKVTLIGKDVKHNISVEELGDLSGRFNYEFVCDISKRVPRVYIQNGEVVE